MAAITWTGATHIRSKIYVCGYCSARVGPNTGIASTNNQPQVFTYFCSNCGQPTYFDEAGPLKGLEIENFIRNAIATVWHQTCTAKMGRDAMSVVDHELKVHEIENLRIADGSIMPRVTTGNTMAPASSSASVPPGSCERGIS